jgi:SAM-dependent methyltransferase
MEGRKDYYDERLAAENLRRCYEIAPARVKRYLRAEVEHVLGHIRPGDRVLDLGCGYGRTLPDFAARARLVIGVDRSLASLAAARAGAGRPGNCMLACMDAADLGLKANLFDVVVCIQNGISAFHVDRRALMAESLRVARPGATLLFSTYSARFWESRLEWFRLQSAEGLLGEIDWDQTRDGVIVCKDGFHAATVAPAEFARLAHDLGVKARLVEVDESSLFCEITSP